MATGAPGVRARATWPSWAAISASWTSCVPSKMLVIATSRATFWNTPAATPSRR